ncbi:MAG TPA: oligosaccharide flippase family protein [Planctomycetota bacterium]|nr:oligosaccharide flippase family protein [Planctomycetota bacterium]
MWLMDGWDTLKERVEGYLPAGSLRARFARGAFWSTVGVLIAQCLGFVASVVVVRFLGRVTYGEFGMIRNTVGMFGVLAGLSLGMTATKYVAEFRQDDPRRAGRIIGLSSLVALASGGATAVVMYFLAPFLARTINAPHLVVELRIGAVLLLAEAMVGAQIGALAGLEAFRDIAKVNLYRGLLNFPVMIVTVYLWGLRGAVIALSAVAVCAWGLSFLALRRCTRSAGLVVRYRHVLEELPVLWKFALPASLCGMMYMPAVWGASALLSRQPDGYAQLGIFTAAGNLRSIVVLVGLPLGSVLLPILSSREGQRSHLFQKVNVLVTWMLGILVAVPVICFPEVIGTIFGREIKGETFSITLVLVILSTAIMTYKQGLARAIAAKSLMWWGFLSNAVWAVLLLGAMVVGRHYGSVGMAVAYVLAYGLNTLVFVPFYLRRGVVPKELMWSPYVLMVWLVLIGAVVANLFEPGWVVRAFMAVVLLGVIAYAARGMLRVRGVSPPTKDVPPGAVTDTPQWGEGV